MGITEAGDPDISSYEAISATYFRTVLHVAIHFRGHLLTIKPHSAVQYTQAGSERPRCNSAL